MRFSAVIFNLATFFMLKKSAPTPMKFISTKKLIHKEYLPGSILAVKDSKDKTNLSLRVSENLLVYTAKE